MRSLARIVAGIGMLAILAAPQCLAACTSCEQARQRDGWCEACGVGYVAGVRIESRYLYEVLDAHGHQIDPASLECASCRAAYERDGFCSVCKTGYVRGEAYFSRLTYEIARGTRRVPADLTCPVCRANAKSHGWCETCGKAMIGNVAISSRQAYEHVVEAIRILQLANAEAQRCEHCAAAIVTDTECPLCRIRYKNGKAVARRPR
jgi:hypothetical protein